MTTTLNPYETTHPMPWMHPDAPAVPCTNTDPEAFWPEKGRNEYVSQTARGVCASCPLQVECLQWAMDERVTVGVWGGRGPAQRRQLRRRWAA